MTALTPRVLSDQALRAMGCAALNPGLGSVLIFDAQPDQLHEAAGVFASMIAGVTAQPVSRIVLGSEESEDDLWGSFEPGRKKKGDPLVWRSGLLSPMATKERACLIVVPDLERINAAVARALVVAIGADVANLERYGRHEEWRPHFYWLGGCPGNAAGRVSLHLLDRFALRLHAQRPRLPDARGLVDWLNREAEPSRDATAPEPLLRQIRSAATTWPEMSAGASNRAVEYASDSASASPRRTFALARLGHGLARLAGLRQVAATHIDEAARLIGLPSPAPAPGGQPDSSKSEASPLQAGPAVTPDPQGAAHPSVPQTGETASTVAPENLIPKALEQTVAASPVTELPSVPLAAHLDPYREDHQPYEREAASLRIPFQRSSSGNATRGVIVGTQPARNLHDLALVSTLLESTKYQYLRRHSLSRKQRGAATDENRLLIAPADLRGYRRAPEPEQVFLLLLDYTCLEGRRWLESLLPHFKQAYVSRARIVLVQVGAATAGHVLRAEKQIFNSVLVPALAASLETDAGKATPLAHGLELALQTLKHALQHGRQTARNARMVVITDGRGNVPLTASITGTIEGSVGREGIEDALASARRFRALDRVDISFYDPQPTSHAGLVSDLAEALGTLTQPIPLLEPVASAQTA